MDNPLDPDFSSSDLEPEELDREPFATRGRASLDSMLRSAVEDRKTSKLKTKSLKLQSKTPGVEASQAMWTTRFRFFRENTLRVDAHTTPDCDHLERFLTTIVKHIRSRNPDPEKNAVSFETISQGLESVTKHCVFEYKDFKLDRRDRFRLSSTVERMIKEGVVTREPARAELMWITWGIIHRMNMAILRDAIENGVLSWDYAIYKVLFLSFQCALACRVGDIMKTGLYESTICLQYRDVKIKLLKQGSEEKLWAVITLRALKGQKLDPRRSKIVEIGEVMNPDFNACCPIKVLLIWAMRVGAISYTSWDQLLAHLRNQGSSTLSWTRPHFPIFCAMKNGGSRHFDFEKSAATLMGSRILSCGAQLIGLLGRPITHDIRRGAARELCHIPDTIPGMNVEVARIGLGHTRKAQQMGVTGDYVGHVATDLFERRRNAGPDNLPGHGTRVNFADSAYARPKKRKSSTIDEVCARHSLDPMTRAGRSLASYYANKEDWDAWITEKKSRLHESSGSASNDAKWVMHHQHKPSNRQTLAPIEPARTESSLSIEYISTGPGPDGFLATEPSIPLSDHDSLCVSDDDLPVDPALQGLSDSLFIASRPVHDQLASQIALSLETEGPLPQSCVAISSDRATFVGFFSTINITTAVNPRSFVRHNHRPSFTGHTSRNEASKFRWPCPNAIFGCEKTFVEAYVATVHHGICTITSAEAHRALVNEQARRKFACSQCSAGFFTARELDNHVGNVHFVPQKCTRAGCSCQVVFNTKTTLRNHVDQTHRGWATKNCPITSCDKATHVFATPKNLKLHLQKKHNFSEAQIAPYIPAPRASPTFKRQRCSHPNCTTTTLFSSLSAYKSHADHAHGTSGDD